MMRGCKNDQSKMKITTTGVVSLGVVGVVVLVVSEMAVLKTYLHRAIARCLSRRGRPVIDSPIDHGAPTASQNTNTNTNHDEPSTADSGYSDKDIDEAIARAIEIERARHEPYPHEWE